MNDKEEIEFIFDIEKNLIWSALLLSLILTLFLQLHFSIPRIAIKELETKTFQVGKIEVTKPKKMGHLENPFGIKENKIKFFDTKGKEIIEVSEEYDVYDFEYSDLGYGDTITIVDKGKSKEFVTANKTFFNINTPKYRYKVEDISLFQLGIDKETREDKKLMINEIQPNQNPDFKEVTKEYSLKNKIINLESKETVEDN